MTKTNILLRDLLAIAMLPYDVPAAVGAAARPALT